MFLYSNNPFPQSSFVVHRNCVCIRLFGIMGQNQYRVSCTYAPGASSKHGFTVPSPHRYKTTDGYLELMRHQKCTFLSLEQGVDGVIRTFLLPLTFLPCEKKKDHLTMNQNRKNNRSACRLGAETDLPKTVTERPGGSNLYDREHPSATTSHPTPELDNGARPSMDPFVLLISTSPL